MKKVLSILISICFIFLFCQNTLAVDNNYKMIFPKEVNAIAGITSEFQYYIIWPELPSGFFIVTEFLDISPQIEHLDVRYENYNNDSFVVFRFKEDTLPDDYHLTIETTGYRDEIATSLPKRYDVTIHLAQNPDQIAPILIIVDPPVITNQPLQEIRGIVKNSIELLINDQKVDLYNDFTFMTHIRLFEGQNTITCLAKNKKGLETKLEYIVTLDITPPTLVINEIPKTVYEKTIFLRGKTDDGQIFINDFPITVENDKTFSVFHPLTRGTNNLEIKAVDLAGNINKFETQIFSATKISLKIGSREAYINNIPIKLNFTPYLENNLTMVNSQFITDYVQTSYSSSKPFIPLRQVVESLGYKVIWDNYSIICDNGIK